MELLVEDTTVGLGATPSTLAFGQVPTGAKKTLSVSISNTGTSSLTITGNTPPSGAFSATGFPAVGTVLAAGASVSVSVTDAPTTAGAQSDSLTVTSDPGRGTTFTVEIPVDGQGGSR